MVKAIIFDDGYHSKNVMVKFGQNYQLMGIQHFLSCLQKRHDDWAVKTAHREAFSESYFEFPFDRLHYGTLYGTYQYCEDFETLWESDELVDGIDLY